MPISMIPSFTTSNICVSPSGQITGYREIYLSISIYVSSIYLYLYFVNLSIYLYRYRQTFHRQNQNHDSTHTHTHDSVPDGSDLIEYLSYLQGYTYFMRIKSGTNEDQLWLKRMQDRFHLVLKQTSVRCTAKSCFKFDIKYRIRCVFSHVARAWIERCLMRRDIEQPRCVFRFCLFI